MPSKKDLEDIARSRLDQLDELIEITSEELDHYDGMCDPDSCTFCDNEDVLDEDFDRIY